jgi:hypothetical protein
VIGSWEYLGAKVRARKLKLEMHVARASSARKKANTIAFG